MATIARALPVSRDRLLAVGLLLLAIIVAVGVLVLPFYLLHRHYDDAIASMQDRLERYRRVAAQAPELKNALETVRAKNGRRFFLKNTAPNLAGAELDGLVAGIVESNGGRITTRTISPPKEEGGFRQIGINLQLFATTPALQKIVYALESQEPYLIIDNMTVRPLNAFRGFKPAPGAEPEVSLLLDISAYAYPEPAKK
jgi:general secretion pathway protein M